VTVCFSRGRSKTEEVPLSHGPLNSLYNTRVTGYMSGERGGECACTTGVWEKLAAWLLVSNPGDMPHACILAVECFCHLAFAWVNERTQTSRVEIQLVGGCMADKHVRS
jgi:hypothetical protein